MNKILFVFVFLSVQVNAQQILPEAERAVIVNDLLADRFNNLLPELMDRTGIDMWILISREYNEDPVLKTMLPATWLNARRRTIILFYRNKENNSIDKLAVARYNFGENIISAWDKEEEPSQWKRLMDLIEERDPKSIGLNYSTHFNIADGLDKTDYDEFMQHLPEKYKKQGSFGRSSCYRVDRDQDATRNDHYNQLVDITHDIIKEAFSEKVITAGITTTTDVEWWFRQKVTDLGLNTWFHPSVDVQRTNEQSGNHLYSFSNRPENMVILPGDLLHCDFGITYLRLNTDCQELAYVLKPGETAPPDYLVKALADGNRVQDIFTSNFEFGKTGNQILLKSLEEAKSEGLQPSIYTHPLGSYGHSSGPTIGLWDSQGGVKGAGDYPLYYNTVYAIELNTTVNIPQWKRDIRIMLEEAGFYGDNGFRYVNGRQTELLTIPRIKPQLGN